VLAIEKKYSTCNLIVIYNNSNNMYKMTAKHYLREYILKVTLVYLLAILNE